MQFRKLLKVGEVIVPTVWLFILVSKNAWARGLLVNDVVW